MKRRTVRSVSGFSALLRVLFPAHKPVERLKGPASCGVCPPLINSCLNYLISVNISVDFVDCFVFFNVFFFTFFRKLIRENADFYFIFYYIYGNIIYTDFLLYRIHL